MATERIDGLYLRSDLAAGFGAAAFVGSPVVTQSNFKGGDITYGGRVSQGNPKYYSIGLSALRTDYDNSRIREEQGIDIWAQSHQSGGSVGQIILQFHHLRLDGACLHAYRDPSR